MWANGLAVHGRVAQLTSESEKPSAKTPVTTSLPAAPCCEAEIVTCLPSSGDRRSQLDGVPVRSGVETSTRNGSRNHIVGEVPVAYVGMRVDSPVTSSIQRYVEPKTTFGRAIVPDPMPPLMV